MASFVACVTSPLAAVKRPRCLHTDLMLTRMASIEARCEIVIRVLAVGRVGVALFVTRFVAVQY